MVITVRVGAETLAAADKEGSVLESLGGVRGVRWSTSRGTNQAYKHTHTQHAL